MVLPTVFIVLLSAVYASSAPTCLKRRATGKAGISWPQQELSAKPVELFFGPESKLTWWSNWNKNYGTTLFPDDEVEATVNAEFVPMQYDTAMLFNADPMWTGWKEVMGYNEPDLFSETGVSVPMPVEVAGDNWKTMVATLREQNPEAVFFSPAVAYNRDWLAGFLKHICPNGVQGCDVAPNYLSIHIYALDIEHFKQQVSAYHDQFGIDLVISEFACYSWDGSNPQPSPEEVSNFMKLATEWLNETAWIHKYAWFGAARNTQWLWGVAESNRLMDAAGQLTSLGRQYINGGSL